MNISKIILILFRVTLVPIYISYWYLVTFGKQDPTLILTASISIAAALSALSFTAFSTFKSDHLTKQIYLYKLSAVNFFRSTVLAIVAIILVFFINSVLIPLDENSLIQFIKIVYVNVLGFCYGSGIVAFHFGLLQLYEVLEETL